MSQYILNDIAKEYLNKLSCQKTVYEKILDLSEKEASVLNSKPLVLHKVLDFLRIKEQYLDQIYRIEQEIIPLRDSLNNSQADQETSSLIKQYLRDIASILEKLLDLDAGNELLLQQNLKSPIPAKVTQKQAAKAYSAYTK